MKTAFSLLLCSLLLIGTVRAVYIDQQALAGKRISEGLNMIPLEPYHIPGGTSQYLTKARLRAARMEAYAALFPYNMDDAITWVRRNRITIVDPLSKRALMVSLLTDDQLKTYLLQPWGMELSGLRSAGLPFAPQPTGIKRERSGRVIYDLGQAAENAPVDIHPLIAEKMTALAYNTPPPQGKDVTEELAWVRLNLKKIQDPKTGEVLDVMRSPIQETATFLTRSSVRDALGLPALKILS